MYYNSVIRRSDDMDTLRDFFTKVPRAAIAFSGGVDSSYLLYAAVKAGAQVTGYFIKTPFQPEFELEDARRVAEFCAAALRVVEMDVLAYDEVAQNPADRCYYCKKHLFSALTGEAQRDGYTVILDGTNASDAAGDRPGMRALSELGVRSPLRECGLTKSRIRELSKEAGLFTWDKSAYACLATRVATGERITHRSLQSIEEAESILYSMGFSDLRVRTRAGEARLEIRAEQMEKAFTHREEIQKALGKYFSHVALDLTGRG